MVPFSIADADDVDVDADRAAFTWRGRRVEVPLGGPFNVMNSLAAATTAATLGVDLDAIVAGLASVAAVPGRFERRRRPPTAPFDRRSSTTPTRPTGWRRCSSRARRVADGAVSSSCSGAAATGTSDKRPQMGAVAARLRRPRGGHIRQPAVRGSPARSSTPCVAGDRCQRYRGAVRVEADRAAAIELAIDAAAARRRGRHRRQGPRDDTDDRRPRRCRFDDRAVRVLAELAGATRDS